MASQQQRAPPASLEIPEGFTIHTENSARILLPATDDAFLNPVQEFNRDLSVACIRTWGEQREKEREERWRQKLAKIGDGKGRGKATKKRKDASTAVEAPEDKDVDMADHENRPKASVTEVESVVTTSRSEVAEAKKYETHGFTILEALSATGLRAIRYAKEIPLARTVIANDLLPSAVESIKRNVKLNELSLLDHKGSSGNVETAESDASHASSASNGESKWAKVQVNEGDACDLMYSHRPERARVDCVDLDPYGTAAPFIDAAVQSVNDGGLLCVTCTDMQVLATNNYPEKCFSNYGGISVKAEYCHEAALRLVLHSLSTSAARYGRFIQPLLSLSIDFYVRLFVRVNSGLSEVKKAMSKTSTYYVCSGCQSFYEQRLGKMVEKQSDKTGQTNVFFRQQAGPPVGDKCSECNNVLHLAGPMWSGPIHDPAFVGKVLEHVNECPTNYGTAMRMKGMLTLAKDELDTPFYFTPGRLAGTFHCVSPCLDDVANGLLNAGFKVSRSHALAGSLKTDARRQDVHDVIRGWVKENPVKKDSISESSPSHFLHSKTPRFEANFDHHPDSDLLSSKIKIVRYQQNPTPNWGPGTRATGKRKREDQSR